MHCAVQMRGIEERAVGTFHVDHDGGARGETFDLVKNAVDVVLQHVAGNEVAVDLGQLVAGVQSVAAFIIINGNVLLRHGGVATSPMMS